MSKLDVELQPGDRVGTTQWTVVKPLGSGTYGFVYECVHETLRRRAAVKILKPKPGVVAKLGQEKALSAARLLVTFRHPNLPEVYDAQVLEGGDGLPRMWTAMELLEGEELTERLLAGPLMVEQSLRYVLQVAKPLAALDEHSGVIHRDLKPANIFITTDDVVKVLDFDTARLRGAGTVSGSGKAVGSPYYMSPESWRDHSGIDRRVDVWSLGVVLYQCLSGELPFVAPNVYKLMQVIANERPKSLANKVGQDIWHIVEQALQVDREQRWPNMHEFAAVIERVRNMRGWDTSEIKSAKSAKSLMEGATLEDQEAVSRHVLNSEKGRRTSTPGEWEADSFEPADPNESASMAITTPRDAAPPAPPMAATLVLEATEPAATSKDATSEKESTLESASAGGVWLEQPAGAASQPVELPMRSRWRLAGVLVVVAVVSVVGLVMFLRRSNSSAATEATPVTVKVSRTTSPSASSAPTSATPTPSLAAVVPAPSIVALPAPVLPAPAATPLPVKRPERSPQPKHGATPKSIDDWL